MLFVASSIFDDLDDFIDTFDVGTDNEVAPALTEAVGIMTTA